MMLLMKHFAITSRAPRRLMTISIDAAFYRRRYHVAIRYLQSSAMSLRLAVH